MGFWHYLYCEIELSYPKIKGLKPGSLFLWIPDNPWFKPFIMSKTTAFWITEMVNYWSWVYTGMKRVNHKLAGNTCNNAFQLILQCNIVRQWPYFLDLIILLLNRPVLISFTRIRFLSYSGDINHAHKICIFLYGSVNKNWAPGSETRLAYVCVYAMLYFNKGLYAQYVQYKGFYHHKKNSLISSWYRSTVNWKAEDLKVESLLFASFTCTASAQSYSHSRN